MADPSSDGINQDARKFLGAKPGCLKLFNKSKIEYWLLHRWWWWLFLLKTGATDNKFDVPWLNIFGVIGPLTWNFHREVLEVLVRKDAGRSNREITSLPPRFSNSCLINGGIMLQELLLLVNSWPNYCRSCGTAFNRHQSHNYFIHFSPTWIILLTRLKGSQKTIRGISAFLFLHAAGGWEAGPELVRKSIKRNNSTRWNWLVQKVHMIKWYNAYPCVVSSSWNFNS